MRGAPLQTREEADLGRDRDLALDDAYLAGWNAAIDAAVAEAKKQDRTGREWVSGSLWANIIGRVPAALEKLKRGQ